MEIPAETIPALEAGDQQSEPAGRVVGRIRRIAAAAYAVFAVCAFLAGGLRGIVGLTCSAAVVMINFLWLEEVVNAVLQPAPRLHAWRLMSRTMARFAFLGAAVWVLMGVARFDALTVLLGFSIVVVGIMGEALYSAYKSFT